MGHDDEDIPQLDIETLIFRAGEWVDFTHSLAIRRRLCSHAKSAHEKMEKAYDLIHEAKTQMEIALETEQER
jgi:hypothetical protein